MASAKDKTVSPSPSSSSPNLLQQREGNPNSSGSPLEPRSMSGMLNTTPAAKPRTKGLSMPALGRKNKPTRQAPGLEVLPEGDGADTDENKIKKMKVTVASAVGALRKAIKGTKEEPLIGNPSGFAKVGGYDDRGMAMDEQISRTFMGGAPIQFAGDDGTAPPPSSPPVPNANAPKAISAPVPDTKLRDFLASIDLLHLYPLLQEQEVDFKALHLLSDEDLEKLGIKLGPRRCIIEACKKRKEDKRAVRDSRSKEASRRDGKDMDKERRTREHKSRDKDKEDREKSRDKGKHMDQKKPREKERGKDHTKDKDRDRERDREREKEKARDRDSRDARKDRDDRQRKDIARYKHQDRDRSRERSRGKLEYSRTDKDKERPRDPNPKERETTAVETDTAERDRPRDKEKRSEKKEGRGDRTKDKEERDDKSKRERGTQEKSADAPSGTSSDAHAPTSSGSAPAAGAVHPTATPKDRRPAAIKAQPSPLAGRRNPSAQRGEPQTGNNEEQKPETPDASNESSAAAAKRKSVESPAEVPARRLSDSTTSHHPGSSASKDQEASADKDTSPTGPTGSESPLVSLMAKRRLSFQAATYKAFPYEDLCKPIPPAGVDKARKEQYLSAQEFEALFGCTKEEFQTWPAWKQMAAKRKLNL